MKDRSNETMFVSKELKETAWEFIKKVLTKMLLSCHCLFSPVNTNFASFFETLQGYCVMMFDTFL